MGEKTYLKWYNKIGYGSGDIAGNVVYAFLSSFVMIYLTNTIGLSAGIVGTLIAVSKLFDGFTDIFFGSMIDRTHSKLGKTLDAVRLYRLCGYACGDFCRSHQLGEHGTVYMVFYRLYPVKRRVLYGQ